MNTGMNTLSLMMSSGMLSSLVNFSYPCLEETPPIPASVSVTDGVEDVQTNGTVDVDTNGKTAAPDIHTPSPTTQPTHTPTPSVSSVPSPKQPAVTAKTIPQVYTHTLTLMHVCTLPNFIDVQFFLCLCLLLVRSIHQASG